MALLDHIPGVWQRPGLEMTINPFMDSKCCRYEKPRVSNQQHIDELEAQIVANYDQLWA
jgi:hypothetical protein